MRGLPILLALFIAVPIIEIYLFIQLGGLIGALPTVLLVIATAVLGVSLLRAQGFQTMAKFQREVSTGQLPANTMLEGIALILGGALLLTPGFMTDTIGFLCLFPLTRQTLIGGIIKRMTVLGSAGVHRQPGFEYPRSPYSPDKRNSGDVEGEIIEGELVDEEPRQDVPSNHVRGKKDSTP